MKAATPAPAPRQECARRTNPELAKDRRPGPQRRRGPWARQAPEQNPETEPLSTVKHATRPRWKHGREPGTGDGDGTRADAAAFGEMGIANTSSATLLAHKLTGASLDALTGRGTGLDDEGLARKRRVLARAAARTAERLAPADALREYGGFEIVMMAGAMIGAARAGAVVIVDGFIASAAALAADGLAPALRDYLVFAHRSAEPGHAAVLDAFGASPLSTLACDSGRGRGRSSRGRSSVPRPRCSRTWRASRAQA